MSIQKHPQQQPLVKHDPLSFMSCRDTKDRNKSMDPDAVLIALVAKMHHPDKVE